MGWFHALVSPALSILVGHRDRLALPEVNVSQTHAKDPEPPNFFVAIAIDVAAALFLLTIMLIALPIGLLFLIHWWVRSSLRLTLAGARKLSHGTARAMHWLGDPAAAASSKKPH